PESLPFSPEAQARKKKRGRGTDKQPVAVLIQRDGPARAQMITGKEGEFLRDFVKANVNRNESTLYTDELSAYVTIGKDFAGGHETTTHSKQEYARPGGIHSN